MPVRATDCEVPGAATLMFSVAFFGLVALVGRKVTLTVQLLPAANVAPQVLVWPNWPELVPPSVTLLMVSGAVPVLVTVTA